MLTNAEIIKSSVTVPMILREYSLWNGGRNRRIPCPIHKGQHNNFSFKDDVYKCFVCDSSGDVISLVMELEQCDFKKACDKIDSLFLLGLGEKPTLTANRKRKAKYKEQIKKAEELRAAKGYSEAQYILLLHFRRWLAAQKRCKEVLFDLAYIDRQLDKYLSLDDLIDWDAEARINALLSKHKGGGDFWNLMTQQ